jgi:hypothetical protein
MTIRARLEPQIKTNESGSATKRNQVRELTGFRTDGVKIWAIG